MIQQQYETYTPEHFEVWKILFERQMKNLAGTVTSQYLEGLRKINFEAGRIPNFSETNARLQELTGWQIQAVPGIIPDNDFFVLLSQQKFPATCWLRQMSQLDYIEEPDMFHDVFGHIPLLTNLHYCDFLSGLSRIALRHIDKAAIIELMSRIYWFTIEFGLMIENKQRKIYGAGVISSAGETEYSMSHAPQILPYEVTALFDTPFYKDHIQNKYFVIESFEQLYNSLPAIEQYIETEAAQIKGA